MNINILFTTSQLILKAAYAIAGVDSSTQWFLHVLLSMNEPVQAKTERAHLTNKGEDF